MPSSVVELSATASAGERRGKPRRYLGRYAVTLREAIGAWVIDAMIAAEALVLPLLAAEPGSVLHATWVVNPARWMWQPTIFWLGVAATPLLAWGKARAVAKSQHAIEERVQFERAEERQETLNTLAETGYTQDEVHEVYTRALQRNYDALDANQAVALLQGDIRLVLASIATLASQLERAIPGAQWGANVMQFFPLDAGGPPLPPRVDAARLFERGVTLDDQRGVLYLDRELSTCTEVDSNAVDPNLRDLTLCVPRNKLQGGQHAMLPGAPYCFVHRAMIQVNAVEMVQLCFTGSYRVTPETAEALRSYFASDAGQAIKSVLCHPLMLEDGKQPHGVLNLHSNYEGMFADDARRSQLYYLLRPTTLVLLQLLQMLRRAEGAVMTTAGRGASQGGAPASSTSAHGKMPPAVTSESRVGGARGRNGRGRRNKRR